MTLNVADYLEHSACYVVRASLSPHSDGCCLEQVHHSQLFSPAVLNKPIAHSHWWSVTKTQNLLVFCHRVMSVLLNYDWRAILYAVALKHIIRGVHPL